MGILDFLKTKDPVEELQKIEISYNLDGTLEHDSYKEVFIGDINLPSGKIIVSDPFFTHSQRSFARSVMPGIYPVYLYLKEVEAGHHKVAFAKVKFTDCSVAKCILAITEDLNPADVYDIEDDEYFGFIVESGLGCIVDIQTNEVYLNTIDEFYIKNPDLNYYDDILAPEFVQCSSDHQYSRDIGDWNNHCLGNNADTNVIMFASGWGDGYYPCYWGLDKNKQIVELTLDFMLDFEEESE